MVLITAKVFMNTTKLQIHGHRKLISAAAIVLPLLILVSAERDTSDWVPVDHTRATVHLTTSGNIILRRTHGARRQIFPALLLTTFIVVSASVITDMFTSEALIHYGSFQQ